MECSSLRYIRWSGPRESQGLVYELVSPRGASPISIAIAGPDFELLRTHLPDEYRRVAVAGTVFARMLPDQKMQLVETLADYVRIDDVMRADGRAMAC